MDLKLRTIPNECFVFQNRNQCTYPHGHVTFNADHLSKHSAHEGALAAANFAHESHEMVARDGELDPEGEMKVQKVRKSGGATGGGDGEAGALKKR